MSVRFDVVAALAGLAACASTAQNAAAPAEAGFFVGAPKSAEGLMRRVRVLASDQFDYGANRHHKPTDEVTPDWDMSGGAQDAALLYAVGRRVADGPGWPAWRADAEFRAAREASRP
jgi:hypothetical protein